MYKIETDQTTSTTTFLLSGSMTIVSAQEIRDALLNALSGASLLVLDQTSIEEYDLSFMQLLISLYKTASMSGKKISFVGNELPLFKSLLSNCGCPEYSWLVEENSRVTPEEK
jgi:anti-anti-sigma regulatory factor